MTQDWAISTDYDPTWRAFRGKAAFDAPPYALGPAGEEVWRPVYRPLVAEAPRLPSPAELAPEPPPWIEPEAAIAPDPEPEPTPVSPVPPAFEPEYEIADASASATAPLLPAASVPEPVTAPSIRVPEPPPPRRRHLATLYASSAAPDPVAPVVPEQAPSTRRQRKPRRRMGRVVVIGAVVAAGVVAAFVLVPRFLARPAPIKTLFTAPMMVLRAVGVGSVATVGVTIGQTVQPNTVLLTIHTDRLSDSALDDLKSRLAQAQTRLNALTDSTTPGTPRRPRDTASGFQVYDANHPPPSQRDKDAAAAEVDRLQKAIANGSTPQPDQPIQAGVRGVVWSLDAQAGGRLKAGDPLAQLADCGRAFLAVQGGVPGLRAGETVVITMPGVHAFHGTVRPSSGVAEPANSLVIDPTGFAAASPAACPVGSMADVQPETR